MIALLIYGKSTPLRNVFANEASAKIYARDIPASL